MNTSIFGSPLFGTLICLILIYALLSLLVSTVTEAINSYFKERGILLFKTLSRLFEDRINVNFGQLLYSHPMIANLKKDKDSLPQYISSQMFSSALIDVISDYARTYSTQDGAAQLAPAAVNKDIFQRFKSAVDSMHHTSLKLVLSNIIDKSMIPTGINGAGAVAATQLEMLDKQLQQWFNDQMERTSGWYKTYMRTRIFWISMLVAIALNADSIHLFQTLYRTPDLRVQLEPIAESLADNYSKQQSDTTHTSLQKAFIAAEITKIKNDSALMDTALQSQMRRVTHQLSLLDSVFEQYDSSRLNSFKRANAEVGQIASLGIPLGWKREQAPLSWCIKNKPDSADYFIHHLHGTFWNVIFYLLGILITGISISFGAPFWFDALIRIVNIRRAGGKPSTDSK